MEKNLAWKHSWTYSYVLNLSSSHAPLTSCRCLSDLSRALQRVKTAVRSGFICSQKQHIWPSDAVALWMIQRTLQAGIGNFTLLQAHMRVFLTTQSAFIQSNVCVSKLLSQGSFSSPGVHVISPGWPCPASFHPKFLMVFLYHNCEHRSPAVL